MTGRQLTRVLLCSASINLGGADLTLVELAAELSRTGYDVEVQLPGEGPLERALRREGVRLRLAPVVAWSWLHPVGARDKVGAVRDAWAVGRREALWVKETADVVLSNTVLPLSPALGAAFARVPHIWLVHEVVRRPDRIHTAIPPSLMSWMIGRLSRAVVYPSTSSAASYPEVPSSRRKIIFPGVHSVVCPPPQLSLRPLRTLLLVGAGAAVKREVDGVRALALLRATGHDLRLRLVGEPSEPDVAAGAESLGKRLGVSELIDRTGRLGDPWADVDPETTVLINCSVSESFGRVTIEAMKRGVVVVAADAAANAELVTDRATGLLYPPTSAGGLADAVALLFHDCALRDRLRLQAWQWAALKFTPAAHADGVRSVIDAVRCGYG